MKFVQIINQKKFALITIFLFLYVLFNLLDGERGLISYYEKQKIKEQLIEEKKVLDNFLQLWYIQYNENRKREKTSGKRNKRKQR